MRLVKTIFLLVAAFLPLPALAQQASMPPLAEEIRDQLPAVGRLNKAGFKTLGSCSGTLIRPDVVLTAGHCAGRLDANTQRMFVAGWDRGEYAAARWVVRQVRHPVYRLNGKHDPRFDVGLAFLESPITEVAPIPLAADDQTQVTLAGYHRYIPHLLSGRTDCPIERREDKVMWIGCPVVSGNSGGPVLEPDGEGGWEVVGVVSSQAKLSAIATRLPQWLFDELAQH